MIWRVRRIVDYIKAELLRHVFCGIALLIVQCVPIWAQPTAAPMRLYVESGVNHSARAVVFSPDGKFIAANGIDRTIRVWSVADRREILSIPYEKDVSSFAFHPTRPVLASHDAYGETINLWDLKEKKLIAFQYCGESGWHTITFSQDGSRLLHASDSLQMIQSWDSELQQQLPTTSTTLSARLKDLTLSQQGELIAGRDDKGSLRIVNVASWTELNALPDIGQEPAGGFRFSLSRSRLGRITSTWEIEIWSAVDVPGSIRRDALLKIGTPHALAFDPNDQLLACALESGDIVILAAPSWKEVARLPSYSNRIEKVGWIEESNALLVQLWPYNKFAKLPVKRALPMYVVEKDGEPHDGWRWNEETSVLGRDISAINQKDSVRLLTDTGIEICTVVLLDKEAAWVVTSPDGRFDTNISLDNVAGVHWIMNGDSFNPVPLEIFMRDYYTPKLFVRLLQGEQLSRVAASDLNRTQPHARQPQVGSSSVDRLTINVALESGLSTVQKDKSGRPLQSGVYDVRLFRDGQLVGQWPEDVPGGVTKSSAELSETEREQWRRQHRVELDAQGQATITFHNIQLPQRKGVDQVTFTAYAFNSDRVKSETSPPLVYKFSPPAQPRVRRAYVITMGVNATQASGPWDLGVAVPSAREAARLWRERLSKQYEVVDVSLGSEVDADGVIARADATKANLHAILDVLAGREKQVNAAVRQTIDPQRKLRPATPDDAVVLQVASHGYADPHGQFFLIPFDTGTQRGIDEQVLTRCQSKADSSALCGAAGSFLSHAISSDDLAAWWTGVDGGEMVMVLDSCHSGAAPGQGFRPGPLGDRGFGQLAYDKGLRIFAATQPEKVARGTAVQGPATLLIEALNTAALSTPGQDIGAWLRTAELMLPQRARQLYPTLNEDDLQWPELMDFRHDPATADKVH